MFNLEQSIAEWRRQMAAGGIKGMARLDELENHLREDICVRQATGEAEAGAFQAAVAALGRPGAVCGEFNKIKPADIWPVKIGSALWIGGVILLAAFLLKGLLNGRLNAVTDAHILCVTAGYTAAFLAGGLAVCYVCLRRTGALSPLRRASLGQAVHRFAMLAVGLSVLGTGLGIPVSRQFFGTYWNWDAKEIGALGVIAWLGMVAIISRAGQFRDRAVMLMALGGNVVVSLAWFGAGLMVSHQRGNSYGWGNLGLLGLWIGLLLVFLAVGMWTRFTEGESEYCK